MLHCHIIHYESFLEQTQQKVINITKKNTKKSGHRNDHLRDATNDTTPPFTCRLTDVVNCLF